MEIFQTSSEAQGRNKSPGLFNPFLDYVLSIGENRCDEIGTGNLNTSYPPREDNDLAFLPEVNVIMMGSVS